MPFDAAPIPKALDSPMVEVPTGFRQETDNIRQADTGNDNAVVQLLTKARDYISDRSRWTTQEYHRPETGAVCAVGSLRLAAGMNPHDGPASRWTPALALAYLLLRQYAERRDFGAIEDLNDALGHQHVLNAFDDAIERAKLIGAIIG